jgi:hypothetical protein
MLGRIRHVAMPKTAPRCVAARLPQLSEVMTSAPWRVPAALEPTSAIGTWFTLYRMFRANLQRQRSP